VFINELSLIMYRIFSTYGICTSSDFTWCNMLLFSLLV